MDPGRWRQVREILEEALELSADAREEFLAAATSDDAELRAEVDSLLAASASAGDLLDIPPHAAMRRQPAALRVGERIGNYRLEEVIGVGGMGEVYRARRADGAFEQQVAIKMVRPDQVRADLIERFATERQVLADLVHPNIARLLDGGAAADGSPYLVMELIDGQPIDRYSDDAGLDTPARLRLLLTVCEAVAFAHEAGVLHRDIKPGNILVTAGGEPKLLDFGLSKVLADPVEADRRTTLRAFTPRYASPEQRDGQPLSFASDVYSLGVILHEILGDADAAGHRALQARLGAIASKATAFNASSRYPAAGDLADDLRAALAGDPRARARASRRWGQLAAIAAAVIAGLALLQWATRPPAALPPFDGTLTPVVSWPSLEWHARIDPAGERIAFLSDRGAAVQLWTRSLADPAAAAVAEVAADASGIAWSTDGSQVLVLEPTAQGSRLRRFDVTVPGTAETTTVAPLHVKAVLRWLRDGLYVLSDGALWRLDPDTGAATRVTAETSPYAIASADIEPGSRRLVFATWVDSREDLWIDDLDGTAARPLTTTPFREYAPSWVGPDRVAFVSNRRGQIDLFEMEVASGLTRFLTSDLALEVAVDASAQGDVLVFSAVREEADLWSIDEATGDTTQLTADSQSDLWPQVTASGRVLFHRTLPTLGLGFRQLETEILVSSTAEVDPGDAFTSLGQGFDGRMSPDEQWLAFSRRASDGNNLELWLDATGAQQAQLLDDRLRPVSLGLFPLGWLGRSVGWGAEARLFWVAEADSNEIWSLDAASGDRQLVARAGTSEQVLDLLIDPTGRRLAFLIEAAGLSIHTASLDQPDPAQLAQLHGYQQARLLDWSGPVAVIAASVDGTPASGVEILAIDATGQARILGAVPGALLGSVTMPAPDRVLATAAPAGAHNLYRLDLISGELRQVTHNGLTAVTFGATVALPDGRLIASRQENNPDLWLLRR